MELFLDTANIHEIETACSWGVISGVTTNPSLFAKENVGGADLDISSMEEGVKRIAALVRGPVSVEVLATQADGMVEQARIATKWSEHVVVKIPISPEGLKATKSLSGEGVRVNMTLVFSPLQALLAALAGAEYVSPFVGRLDDVGHDGMQVVRDTVKVFRTQGIRTKVIAASIRHPLHVLQAGLAGADIATVPFAVLRKMMDHPLTDAGIRKFLEDFSRIR